MVKAAFKELEVPLVDGMISINDAANQFRYSLSILYNDSRVYRINECPLGINNGISAANWIRRYGYPNLTNDSFSGLINGIVGKNLTKDDNTVSQIVTGPEVAIIEKKYSRMFITAEELQRLLSKYDICEDLNSPISKVGSGTIQITNTVLGRHIQLTFN